MLVLLDSLVSNRHFTDRLTPLLFKLSQFLHVYVHVPPLSQLHSSLFCPLSSVQYVVTVTTQTPPASHIDAGCRSSGLWRSNRIQPAPSFAQGKLDPFHRRQAGFTMDLAKHIPLSLRGRN